MATESHCLLYRIEREDKLSSLEKLQVWYFGNENRSDREPRKVAQRWSDG